MLNGAAIGNFNTVGTCSCSSPHGTVSLPNVSTGSYVLGGANSVSIDPQNCEGLSSSAALNGAYARVNVTYACGPDLCAGVTCAAQDQCHVTGSCDPATGLCSNPNAANGTACDDGDPSTPTSACFYGTCQSNAQNGNVGYYDMSSEQGNPNQQQPIVTAGGVPVNVLGLSAAELAGLQVLFVQNPSNSSFGSEYIGQRTVIEDAVAAGMVLIIHDRLVDTANTILPGGAGFTILRDFSDDANIDILDATTLITNGPGGVLNNTSLDNGTSSSHGFAVSGTLPGDSAKILSRTNPTQIVTMCYRFGAGAVVYSTIPLDFYLESAGASTVESSMRLIYAPNVVAYALAGACASP
jgi:hypothetical protein